MAVPSHNFVSGISDDPFNGTLIGIDIDVLVDDSIRAKIVAKQFIHARYNNANKSWTELSVFNDDKPNLGFIRPVFSTTAEDGTTARSDDGGGSATRNLKIGSAVINGVYLGSSQITHVYVGSTLSWSQS
tara:strand:+ start:121 stop:510 length:390 start_codon:yes stop_codon:yes gene_type:complete